MREEVFTNYKVPKQTILSKQEIDVVAKAIEKYLGMRDITYGTFVLYGCDNLNPTKLNLILRTNFTYGQSLHCDNNGKDIVGGKLLDRIIGYWAGDRARYTHLFPTDNIGATCARIYTTNGSFVIGASTGISNGYRQTIESKLLVAVVVEALHQLSPDDETLGESCNDIWSSMGFTMPSIDLNTVNGCHKWITEMFEGCYYPAFQRWKKWLDSECSQQPRLFDFIAG